MRQIQQAVQVLLHALAQVLKLRSEGEYEVAIQRIHDVFGKLELLPRPIAELSTDEVLDMCRTDRGFEVDMALAVADLLAEQAAMLLETGADATAYSHAAKALALYREALRTKGAALPLDIGRKIEGVEGIVEQAHESDT